MDRSVRLRELLVGVAGLALLRGLYESSTSDADARLADVARVLADDEFAAGEPMSEHDPRTGYRAWSGRYDEPGNPMIELEQPAVWALLDAAKPGRALDAACGTGRHAARLVERGHDVLGIDLTPEMLAHARRAVPGARFETADVRHIPAADGEFDLAVSGLALAHVPDLGVAVAELSRVLRPGGTLVISALHPFQAHLGWHAPFQDAEGRRGFVREHAHGHADYLAAFRAAGLAVTDCVEPPLGPDQVRAKRRAFRHLPDATMAAYLGLPGVLVWAARKSVTR